MDIFESGNKILLKFRQAMMSVRPPLEGAYIYIFAALVGFVIADLSILALRPSMLPQDAPPRRPPRAPLVNPSAFANYNTILDRNIFNDDAIISPALSAGQNQGGDQETPVATQLPIKLLGTMVHLNPGKSVASIELTSAGAVATVKIEEDAEQIGKIIAIERMKVIFRNQNNRRLEFVEIPEENAVNFGVAGPVAEAATGEIQKQGEFDFVVDRSMVDQYTADLTSILSQARMVPNFGAGGTAVEGFRFVSIQPNSIYEKLGFKIGDVIKSVNGESINSSNKAIELYNTLRSDSNIRMEVERDGRVQPFNYTVK